jgi:methionyl-tRNA synthetase
MSKFYIATAIPYVNARPHLGHAILHIYADALARYHRQLGDEVLFSAGTDEHGGKIAEVAEKEGLSPQQHVDAISAKFREGLEKLGISNDTFIRTTDPRHEKIAAEIWKNLSADIYKNSYIGMYCVGCEEFKTDSHVKETNGLCPLHNREYEKVEEENYFFRLSKYSAQIKEAITTDTFQILPSSRKNEILGVINEGLEDISISRSAQKITWGIPVPGDPTQVMYVWFEALMNYITVLGYPNSEFFTKFWPADAQVIGKDILRFHAAIWPAMLLGLGIPLPKQLFVHGFVTSGGQKMSKTLGNVVDPIEVVDKYGLDAFRYYIFRHGPSSEDVDFTWEKFEDSYNNELANELGNAVQRVAAMIMKYQEGVIGDIPESNHDTQQYHDAIAECRFDRAMEAIWDQVRGLNQYIEEEKPWSIAKEKDEEHLREVLAEAVSSLLEIADLLVPFLPDTAKRIQDVFASGVVKPFAESSLFPKSETTTPESRG